MITDAAVYAGKVWHRRLRPVEHRFSYPFWWLWVSVDDVEALLQRSPWWGRRWRPVTVRDADYVPGQGDTLRERLERKAHSLDLDWRDGTICLLAQPRILGWCFNPLALYWHFPAGSETPDSAIAEVHNTPWHERHYYRLDVAAAGESEGFRQRKAFHVSPFMPMEQDYRWHLTLENQRLAVVIDNLDDHGHLFSAGVTLERTDATTASMKEVLWRYGAQGIKVSMAIHAHAWRLWRKGVAFQPHPRRRKAMDSE